MNNYRVTLQVNGEVLPLEFFCLAEDHAYALSHALDQVPESAAVIATCELHKPDQHLLGAPLEQVAS